MSISAYPNGFLDGVSIRGLPINMVNPGKVFFVNNSTTLAPGGIGGSDGNGGSYIRPFQTLNGAISSGNVVAGRGDIILVMPNHAETITNGTMLAFNKAGVAIIGLGYGNQRPTFTFSATTSQIVVTGANMSFLNCILVASINAVVSPISCRAAGFTAGYTTKDTSSSIGFVSGFAATSACSDLNLNLKHEGFAAGTAGTKYINLVGATHADINVEFFGKASTAVVNMMTTACTDIVVTGIFNNAQGALSYNVVDSASSTWSVNGFDANQGSGFNGSNNVAVAYYPSAVTSNQTTMLNNMDTSLLKTAANLPASGAGTIFTVSGGPIEILEIYGIVTTVIQTQACNLSLEVIDTASTTTTAICGTVNISAAAVGSFLTITGTLATAMIVNAGGTCIGQATPVVVPVGTIKALTSATNTGQVQWGIRYRPLAAGATVA